MTSCKIPFRGNSRKAIAIRTVVTHSARKEAPGSLLGAGDIPYLYLGGNYAGAGIYQSVSSCPPRLVYFTVCKIHLNKKFNNRREMVPGRAEECQRQREPSGARAAASRLEERARWVEGWTETPGSGRRRERENSGGEEGKAGRTPSSGGMAGGKWRLGLRCQLTLRASEPPLILLQAASAYPGNEPRPRRVLPSCRADVGCHTG